MQAVIKRGFGVTLGVIALAIGSTAPERERAYAQGGGADTHGRDATPDYGRVFIQDQVSRLDLKIAATDWQRLEPVARLHHALIAEAVRADTKKLYTSEAFESGVSEGSESLKSFVIRRRAFLLQEK